MPFLSAAEDFSYRTLAAIEGGLKKLVYLASLRNGNGSYSHWGMERTHGPDASHQSIAAHHTQAWLNVLRTPLPELVSELDKMDSAPREELLAKLSGALEPDEPCGGSGRHFNSTVLALQLVFRPENARKAA